MQCFARGSFLGRFSHGMRNEVEGGERGPYSSGLASTHSIAHETPQHCSGMQRRHEQHHPKGEVP